MSKSGSLFIAQTEGTSFTMYAVMRAMGLPLSEEQAKFQAKLESIYPAVVDKEADGYEEMSDNQVS